MELAQFLLPALDEHFPGWKLTDGGLEGPGSLEVRLAELHSPGRTGHVDVGFCLNRENSNPTVLWDCAVGWGDSEEERMSMAAQLWIRTTLPVIVEFLKRGGGEYAEHYGANDPDGLSGFHTLHGPILGYGTGGIAEGLQEWWRGAGVLAALKEPLSGELGDGLLRGVKLYVCSSGIAEVRLDGQRHEAASAALEAMNWPRSDEFGAVRAFALVLHAG